jgi:hypothetical protein
MPNGKRQKKKKKKKLKKKLWRERPPEKNSRSHVKINCTCLLYFEVVVCQTLPLGTVKKLKNKKNLGTNQK